MEDASIEFRTRGKIFLQIIIYSCSLGPGLSLSDLYLKYIVLLKTDVRLLTFMEEEQIMGSQKVISTFNLSRTG